MCTRWYRVQSSVHETLRIRRTHIFPFGRKRRRPNYCQGKYLFLAFNGDGHCQGSMHSPAGCRNDRAQQLRNPKKYCPKNIAPVKWRTLTSCWSDFAAKFDFPGKASWLTICGFRGNQGNLFLCTGYREQVLSRQGYGHRNSTYADREPQLDVPI